MKKATPSARYPIRAVSRLTGIGIDTLRAWERRHGAVTPGRDHRGRMYTEADVARLRLLKGAVARGHSIGHLAELSDTDLGALEDRHAASGIPASASSTNSVSTESLAALLDGVRTFDTAAIEREIGRLAVTMRPVALLRDVVMPVLTTVGDEWHAGRARIAHEHLLSSVMRNLLGSFLRLYARTDGSPRMLFATPSGERHEIGTLGAAMLAASSGANVVYLGPDLPAREIVEGVKVSSAAILVMGITDLSDTAGTTRELRTLVRTLPKDVAFWLGGRGARAHAATLGARGTVLDTYDAYEQHLAQAHDRMRT